jgi:hypothetical protein
VTAEGEVRAVKPKGKRLEDAGVERCMMNALRASPSGLVPDSASDPLISRRVPGHARGVLGSVTVLPVVVELTAVLATASGVTIIVTIGVIVVAAAAASSDAGPSEEECEEEWRQAKEKCIDWLAEQDPPPNVIGPRKTLRDCMESNVRYDCGGKKVDRTKSPRPGMRF